MTVSIDPETPSAYSFDNADPEAGDRHQYLSAILDDFTFARLSALGDLTGRHCLEVGAGGGSVARWFAEKTGPTGRVIASDLNPQHIPPHPGYSVLRHDLVHDPIPEGPWDVIHARLVLMHIPERREVLRRLAGALAPGGALVIEEWETWYPKLVMDIPTPELLTLFDRYQETLVGKILPARGTDTGWAPHVHGAMVATGLSDVETAIEARAWPGGTPGALLIAVNIGQLHDEFIDAGFTEAELDQLRTLVRDPRFVLRGHFTYCTTGRRSAQ